MLHKPAEVARTTRGMLARIHNRKRNEDFSSPGGRARWSIRKWIGTGKGSRERLFQVMPR